MAVTQPQAQVGTWRGWRRSAAGRTGGVRRHDGRLVFFLLLPAIALELLVHIIPMLIGVFTSLLGLNQSTIRNWSTAPFVGFKNFALALNPGNPIGRQLWTSLGVTVLVTLVAILISWALGMGAALLVEDASLRRKGFFRTLFILPYIIPGFVSAIAWRFMFMQQGTVNDILSFFFHGAKPFWLSSSLSMVVLIVVLIWGTWPFAFLYLMTGLQTIPRERYEAATLDGAGAINRFRYVTLPGLAPINQILFLLMFLWTFNNFTTSFTLFGSAPPKQADIVAVHIYRMSFSNLNYGLGSAMSVVMLVVLLVLMAGYWRALRLGRNEEA